LDFTVIRFDNLKVRANFKTQRNTEVSQRRKGEGGKREQVSERVHRRAAKYAEEAQRGEMVEASFDQKLSAKAFESSLFSKKEKRYLHIL
jgi:hypothetical protein